MNITLYSNNCPKCKILKQKLDEKELTYITCSDVEIMQAKGFKSVPQLEVDGIIMTYMTAIQWIKGI